MKRPPSRGKDDEATSSKTLPILADPDLDETPMRAKKGGGGLAGGFAGLPIEKTLPADENEDFGGLMVSRYNKDVTSTHCLISTVVRHKVQYCKSPQKGKEEEEAVG